MIYGGSSLTANATLINTIIRGISTMLDIGKIVGSSIRRFIDDDKC